MKPILLVSAFLLIPLRGMAAEAPINELLRDGLYSEEVTRDAEAAAKLYDEVISRYSAQRQFAATAVFRLAEVRRKQGRKDEAVALYRRLITEFPEAGTLVNLATDNLASIGGQMPELPLAAAADEESKELARIQATERSSPDLINPNLLLSRLSRAINGDWGRVVDYLLKKGADPNQPTYNSTRPGNQSTPLLDAASKGNLAICELLVKAGAKPNTDQAVQALPEAILKDLPLIVDFLIKNGAEVNYVSQPPPKEDPYYLSTPLGLAAEAGNLPMVEKLLAAGAQVDKAQPGLGITPLHLAAQKGRSKAVKRLLEAGAKPDAAVLQDRHRGNQLAFRAGDTPLLLAAANGSHEILELLVEKSPSADLSPLLAGAGDPGVIKYLLAKGADANAKDAEGRPVLMVWLNEPEIIQMLLDAGADPNVRYLVPENQPNRPFAHRGGQFTTPLHEVLRLSDEGRFMKPVTDALVKAGATPDEDLVQLLSGEKREYDIPRARVQVPGGTKEKQDATRQLLIERFVFPKLAGLPAITLAFLENGILRKKELATKQGDTPAPDLAGLLFENQEAIDWPTDNSASGRIPTRLTIWRTTGAETKPVWQGNLWENSPLPPLGWGDVVCFQAEGFRSSSPSTSRNLAPLDAWSLRKHVTFGIQVQSNDKVVDYQMRGDRLAFDPTSREIPLTDAISLSRLLWNPGTDLSKEVAEIIVSRQGWPDTTIKLDGSYKNLMLEPGDKLKLVAGENPAATDNDVPKVVVFAPNAPARRTFPVLTASDGRQLAPTLCQAIADLLSDPITHSSQPNENPIVPYLSSVRYVHTLWTNPDLSKIRIHRLGEDGRATIIPVDLAGIISSSGSSQTAAEARAADTPLRAGDIVEIPLLGNADGKWTGLTGEQEAFFARTLDSKLQVREVNGKIAFNQFNYGASSIIATEGGRLPVKKADGQDTMRLTRMYGNQNVIKVRRDGIDFWGPADQLFVREGDLVELMEHLQPPMQPRPRVSQPRQQATPIPIPIPTPVPTN